MEVKAREEKKTTDTCDKSLAKESYFLVEFPLVFVDRWR